MEVFYQFLHVLSGSIAAGSILLSALTAKPGDKHYGCSDTAPDTAWRVKIITWICIAVLFATGFHRIYPLLGTPLMRIPYAQMWRIKIVMVFALILSMGAVDFYFNRRLAKTDQASPSFQKTLFWTKALSKVQILFLLGIISFSVRMRLYTW
ncbi:MAG: hypothetical protein HY747_11515 [Elusimicrobia bacterium]|nr:hypothetical protein [Elusimicrobiota bacterium]